MNGLLENLLGQDLLERAEADFAAILGRVAGETAPETLLAVALTCRAVSQGHVCFDLAQLSIFGLAGQAAALPDTDRWLDRLAASPLCGDGSVPTPLILDGTRLYLSRYWHQERSLAARLLARAARICRVRDEAGLEKALDRLFPEQPSPGPPGSQRLAVETAVRRQLAVISGGPGTGKTTTAVKALVALQEQAMHAAGKPLRILLAAPTGKAAARLGEAVRFLKSRLPAPPEVLAAIPEEVFTLHRALGYRGRGLRRFRHDAARLLVADLVVVDESSMVDLAMMARLFEALPEEARVILLGDRDQLAAVGAGSVMGDISRAAEAFADKGGDGYSGGDASPLAACTVNLTRAYRFEASEDLAGLLTAIAGGDTDAALSLLTGGQSSAVRLVPLREGGGLNLRLAEEILAGYRGVFACKTVRDALAGANRFRIMCAHRHGFGGVLQLNGLAEETLSRAGLLRPSGSAWYRGRPVLITENSYAQRLFNGDVGVVWPDRESGGRMRVFFPGGNEGELRSFPPNRLPAHETVYAMTVHKGQGSEYEQVVLVLPEQLSPILTRELLYTGISRARNSATIYGAAPEVRAALQRRVEKISGLRARLAGG